MCVLCISFPFILFLRFSFHPTPPVRMILFLPSVWPSPQNCVLLMFASAAHCKSRFRLPSPPFLSLPSSLPFFLPSFYFSFLLFCISSGTAAYFVPFPLFHHDHSSMILPDNRNLHVSGTKRSTKLTSSRYLCVWDRTERKDAKKEGRQRVETMSLHHCAYHSPIEIRRLPTFNSISGGSQPHACKGAGGGAPVT